MASLKDIRRRITSVKNTQQITKAMKLVAASKLRRAQMAIAGARAYSTKLSDMSQEIMRAMKLPTDLHSAAEIEKKLKNLHPLLRQPTPGDYETDRPKKILLVITSDRGLCGAYNTAASKVALARLRQLQSEGQDVDLYCVGKKGCEFLAKRGFKGKLFENFWAGRFDIKRADVVAKDLSERFLNGEVDSVEVVYTEFRSAISQTVKTAQVLPLSLTAENQGTQNRWDYPPIVEPSPEALLKQILPMQLRMKFYALLADSLASEYGAKMTSMDNATRNAGQMISRLTLEANRVRQAGITKELLEIISGAEALKG